MCKVKYVIVFLCVSLHAVGRDTSPYDEIFMNLVTDYNRNGEVLFVAGCEESGSELIQIIPKKGQGLFVQLKDSKVTLLSEISYSTKVETPLIEVDGGIEISKHAYELYEMVKDQAFRIVTIYSYDYITKEIKFGTCNKPIDAK